MADKKAKRPTYISPEGIGQFCWLNKPDTKFDAEGAYKTNLILDGADAEVQAMIEQIDEMLDAQREETLAELKPAKKKSLSTNDPYEAEVDENTEEETGRFVFKFSTKAAGTIKNGPKAGQRWERKLPIFDAKNKPTTVNVFGGSKLKVAYSMAPYYIPGTNTVGVKLYLEAVQVIEVAARNSDGGSFGFGQTDGFEDSGEPATPFGGASDAEDSGSEGGDASEY